MFRKAAVAPIAALAGFMLAAPAHAMTKTTTYPGASQISRVDLSDEKVADHISLTFTIVDPETSNGMMFFDTNRDGVSDIVLQLWTATNYDYAGGDASQFTGGSDSACAQTVSGGGGGGNNLAAATTDAAARARAAATVTGTPVATTTTVLSSTQVQVDIPKSALGTYWGYSVIANGDPQPCAAPGNANNANSGVKVTFDPANWFGTPPVVATPTPTPTPEPTATPTSEAPVAEQPQPPVAETPAPQPIVATASSLPGAPPGSAKLALAQKAGKNVVQAGGLARFNLQVTNTSGVLADDVVVCNPIPKGTQLAKVSRTYTLKGKRVCVNVGDLAPGRSAKVTIALHVDRGGAKGFKVANRATANAKNAPRSVRAAANVRVPRSKAARVRGAFAG